jgi:hypothetical protein
MKLSLLLSMRLRDLEGAYSKANLAVGRRPFERALLSGDGYRSLAHFVCEATGNSIPRGFLHY